MSEREIKPCPFCGGKNITFKNEVVKNYGYLGDDNYRLLYCGGCGASTKKIRIKFFIEMSDYTVEDFRKNDSLRPLVEKIHQKHKDDVDKNLINAWNKRNE